MNTAALRVAGGPGGDARHLRVKAGYTLDKLPVYCSIERLTSIHAYGQVKKKTVQMNPMCMLGARILREAVQALEGHADDAPRGPSQSGSRALLIQCQPPCCPAC